MLERLLPRIFQNPYLLADIAYETKDTVIPLTEFVSLSDSISRSRVSFISLGESISITDSASETREKNVPLTETQYHLQMIQV